MKEVSVMAGEEAFREAGMQIMRTALVSEVNFLAEAVSDDQRLVIPLQQIRSVIKLKSMLATESRLPILLTKVQV